MRLIRHSVFAALAAMSVSLPAAAEGDHDGFRSRVPRYGTPHVVYARGFAEPFLRGEYIGAPYSVVPRPSQLVPTPWSYGTYGVPTVSGIVSPPIAAPSLTVIHSQGARRGERGTASVPANVQEVNVRVPRR